MKLADLEDVKRSHYVREMFSRIAPRYDLMNRVMTGGQDVTWRREVIRRAALPPAGLLLDLGAGTGDLSFEALRSCPCCGVMAADFTHEMMRAGQDRVEKSGRRAIPYWCAADALNLPFAAESFDALVSGFLLRNVIDVRGALREQARVLKPGGRWVALDTTRPRPSPLSPLVKLHLHLAIPILGRLLTGQPDAYRYLPESTENFLEAEQLAARMAEAGLREVGFRLAMFGTVAIHWGVK